MSWQEGERGREVGGKRAKDKAIILPGAWRKKGSVKRLSKNPKDKKKNVQKGREKLENN